MIIVLADDITGAAEIAGIAITEGKRTVLAMGKLPESISGIDVIVIATDIRSGDKTNAKMETLRLCQGIKDLSANYNKDIILFKKTDSVLRGHISTELSVIMEQLNYNCSLLIAQNPSKGRIIKDGIYLIDGKPLNETPFHHDPEFPAWFSSAVELIGKDCSVSLPVGQVMPHSTKKQIFVADAANQEEMCRQAEKSGRGVLLAGGADFFKTILSATEEKGIETNGNTNPAINKSARKILVVSGSTQGKKITDTPFMLNKNTVEVSIPDDVFEGANPNGWINGLTATNTKHDVLIMRVGNHEVKGAEYARRIRAVMAKAANSLVKDCIPDYLIIEGGATAFSVLAEIGWTSFIVTKEYAPGVVGMKHDNTEIILKPGSYSWGDLFK